MGPLRLIEDLPAYPGVNGDILSDINYGELLGRHSAEERLFTIATSAREQYIDYGVLERSLTNKSQRSVRSHQRI